MKRVTILLLSFCLFHLQINWALAADTTTDKDNVVTIDRVENRGDSEAKSAMMLNSLAIFASGLMGPMYLMWCRNRPSAYIYAATAGIYVGAEIIGWRKYKDATNREMKAYKDKDIEQQVNSIKAAANQTQAAQDSAKRKAKYANLAATGYSAAAVMALAELAYSWYTGEPGAPCSGVGSSSTGQLENINFKTQKAMATTIKESSSDIESVLLFDELVRYANGAKRSISINDYEAQKKIHNKLGAMGLKAGVVLAVEQMDKLIFGNSAYAGFGDNQLEKAGIFLGLAGATAIALWGNQIVGQLPDWMNKVSRSGITRAAVFGAHALVAKMGSSLISKVEDKLGKRVAQYHLLASKLQSMGAINSIAAGNDSATTASVDMAVDTSIVESQPFSNDSTTCFVTDTKDQTLLDETCSCKKTNSCKKSMVPTTKFKGFSMGEGYNQALSSLNSAGNSLYSGDYSAASTSADSAIGRGAAINKMEKNLVDKINDHLVKNGGKAQDFNKHKDNFKNAFTNGVKSSLQKMSADDAKKLMALGTGPGLSNPDEEKIEVTKTEDGKIKVTTTKDASFSVGNSVDKKNSDPFAGMDFSFEDKNKKTDATKLAKKDEDPGYDYSKTDANQISNNSNVSIFQMITTRYMKTAFPILFDEQ